MSKCLAHCDLEYLLLTLDLLQYTINETAIFFSSILTLFCEGRELEYFLLCTVLRRVVYNKCIRLHGETNADSDVGALFLGEKTKFATISLRELDQVRSESRIIIITH